MKYAFSHIPALCILLLAGAAHAADRNLVLHRAYDFWTEPTYDSRYGADKHEQHISLLTDGYTNYQSGDISTQKTALTWFHPLNEPIVVWFDLGQPAALAEVRFNTAGGPEPNYMWDPVLRVYTSLDDRQYVLAGELILGARPKALRGIQIVVPLKGVKARYVGISAMAPAPRYTVAVDEIEVIGDEAPSAGSPGPKGRPIAATGARQLQESLARAAYASQMMKSLLAPVRKQVVLWPAKASEQQKKDIAEFTERCVSESGDYDKLRSEATQRHRVLARGVYGADTLVWETIPDAKFGMLSLPETLKPANRTSVNTVVNALEATALGVANLTDRPVPLAVSVTGGGPGTPSVTPRIARFFLTTNARYVPDALIASDSPQTIPSGESRLVWLDTESTGAKPGTYRYEVTVRVGEKSHRIPLQVVVYDITLSEKTPLTTFNWSYLNDGHNGDPIYKKVREAMLSYRITNGACCFMGPLLKADEQGNIIRPVEINLTKMNNYLEFNKDFPIISFSFPFDQTSADPTRGEFGKSGWMSDEFKAIFKEWVVAFVGLIKSKGRDYNGFYFQMFDETFDPKVGEICKLVHEADPKVKMMITIDANSGSAQGFVDAGMNIFTTHASRLGYDNAPDEFPILRSGGRSLWFYHAADDAAGAGRERDPLDVYRLLHWLAFRHGATGVGFWDMMEYELGSSRSCWAEGKGHTYYPMVYTIPDALGNPPPPDVKTAEMVIPSRRWEYTRMGIEDYMLLQMAREKIATLEPAKRAKYLLELNAIVKTVLTNLPAPPATTSDANRRVFRQKRLELVQMVAELSGNQKTK